MPRTVFRVAGRSITAAFLLACSSSTAPDTPLKTVQSPFTATVISSTRESGNGPAGPYAQTDIWLAVPPSHDANVGVVAADVVPVYLSIGTMMTVSTASAIRAGDILQVTHNNLPGYGAVQAPPGAPVYTATQIVIFR